MGSGQSRKTRQLHQKITELACAGAEEEKYKQMGATDAQVARISGMIVKYLRNTTTVQKEGIDRRAIIAVIIAKGRKRGFQTDEHFYRACLLVFNILYDISS